MKFNGFFDKKYENNLSVRQKKDIKQQVEALPDINDDEDKFIIGVYHSIRNYGFNKPITHERLKDGTYVFRYPELATFPIGRIKLRGRKTKIQIISKNVNYWVENKTLDEYIELTDKWGQYLNEIVKYNLGNTHVSKN